MRPSSKCRWYQFSLKYLLGFSFATTFLFAIWWSHRLHCLEKSEFHRRKSEIYLARFDHTVEESEAEDLAQYHAELDRVRGRSLRWEEQTIDDSIQQGYLIAPMEDSPIASSSIHSQLPPSSKNSTHQDESLSVLKNKLAPLADQAKIHDRLRAEYLRAIFRPWMFVQEPFIKDEKGEQ